MSCPSCAHAPRAFAWKPGSAAGQTHARRSVCACGAQPHVSQLARVPRAAGFFLMAARRVTRLRCVCRISTRLLHTGFGANARRAAAWLANARAPVRRIAPASRQRHAVVIARETSGATTPRSPVAGSTLSNYVAEICLCEPRLDPFRTEASAKERRAARVSPACRHGSTGAIRRAGWPPILSPARARARCSSGS